MLFRLVSVVVISALFFMSRYYVQVESRGVAIGDRMLGVVELTDENWQTYTSKQKEIGKPMFVVFYDSKCPWSAKLAPTLQVVGETIMESSQRDRIILGKMNLRTPNAISVIARLGIRAYPTLVLFAAAAATAASDLSTAGELVSGNREKIGNFIPIHESVDGKKGKQKQRIMEYVAFTCRTHTIGI